VTVAVSTVRLFQIYPEPAWRWPSFLGAISISLFQLSAFSRYMARVPIFPPLSCFGDSAWPIISAKPGARCAMVVAKPAHLAKSTGKETKLPANKPTAAHAARWFEVRGSESIPPRGGPCSTGCRQNGRFGVHGLSHIASNCAALF
jgi:hypothetical protein